MRSRFDEKGLGMTGHDIGSTCCKARCVTNTDDGIEYGVPGLEICASVAKGSREEWPFQSGVWRYEAHCHIAKRHVRGVKSSRKDVLSEMALWLGTFGCPGDIPKGDVTADDGGGAATLSAIVGS